MRACCAPPSASGSELIVVDNRCQPKVALRNAQHLIKERVDLVIEFQTDEAIAPANRTWTIRTDGSQKQLMHKRTMDMEINGHEWWSWDGNTIWFDLQTPRSQVFWIAGVEMATGRKIRYHVERDWWSVHFNSSRDNTLFAGDGGDPSQVAYATDGLDAYRQAASPGPAYVDIKRPAICHAFTPERLIMFGLRVLTTAESDTGVSRRRRTVCKHPH